MATRHLHAVDPEQRERIFGSERFISRTREPALRSPVRFEPTVKNAGDVVI